MKFDVSLSTDFQRDFKPLVKKYRSLKNELADLIDTLEVDPKQGSPLVKVAVKFDWLSEAREKVNRVVRASLRMLSLKISRSSY